MGLLEELSQLVNFCRYPYNSLQEIVTETRASTRSRRALLWRKLMDDLRQELSDLVQKIDSVVERL